MTRQPTPDIMADVLTSTPVKLLAHADIRTDGGTQPRAEISADLVTEYTEAMSAGAQFPPVVIYYDGSDYWLADGFHRLRALANLGRPVLADIRQGTRRDAVLFSAGANATHGQRRTNADKRRAVLALLHDDEWQQWSDREIARRCAVSNRFVGDVRAELSVNRSQIATRRVVRQGTEYDMTVPPRLPAPDQARQGVKYAAQVDLQLAIGDWLDAFDDPEATLNELARDGRASIHWEDLTSSVPPCRAPDLVIAIAAFRQRMASTRKQLAKPDQPPPARQPQPMDVHYSSDSPEWLTPRNIVQCVQRVLHHIDLDPCSNVGTANIPALRTFTWADNGLAQPWTGTVYMNPPYGRTIGDWVDKLVSEYESGAVVEAIALVPARTDTEWFKRFRRYPRCFVFGRLSFSNSGTAPFPSVAVYLGQNLPAFLVEFSSIGDTFQLVEAANA